MVQSRSSFHGASRRKWLKAGSAASLLVLSGRLGAVPIWQDPKFTQNPFTLGVASGDPMPDGFVIWTKLAPQPLAHGAGMPPRAVEVEWTVAGDARMAAVVQRGKTIAHPELGHAVHVEVQGLNPAADYFYRFTVAGEASAVGRARTLPPAGAAVAEIRFGVAGCQRYEEGYFSAWRHLAAERPDFIFHYGDYIYEYGPMRDSASRRVVRPMPGAPAECYTLDDYRNRYALYKLDPDMQAAHHAAPFVMSFDDHEVDNNWAGDSTEEGVPAEIFLLRRAAAFQAWYEHMPVRRGLMPDGPRIQMYRRFDIGSLMQVNVLDTRQYRAPIVCSKGDRAGCAAAADPQRSMIGAAQERWLHEGFRGTQPVWTLLAQQVPIMRGKRSASPGVTGGEMDKWDGYSATRDRLFDAVQAARLGNLVAVCGDVHFNCAGELKRDFGDAKSATLGVEFVGTSVTSLGDGADSSARLETLLRENQHIRFANGQRGYMLHTVTPRHWQADYKVLDKISVSDGRLSTRRSFVAESGMAGLKDA